MADNPILLLNADAEMQLLEAAERRRARHAAARQAVSLQQAQRVSDLAELFPSVSDPNILVAAALSNLSDDQVARVVEQDIVAQSEAARPSSSGGGGIGGLIGNVGDFIGDRADDLFEQVLTPTVRGTLAALDTALHETLGRTFTGVAVAAADQFNDDDASTNFLTGFARGFTEVAGNSDLVQALHAQFDADPNTKFDLGTGFLPGATMVDDGAGGVMPMQGSSAVEAHRQRTQFTLGGLQLTPGNLTAGLVNNVGDRLGFDIVEPGTPGFQMLAGVGDLATALAVDPANLAAQAARGARAADLIANAGVSRRTLAGQALVSGSRSRIGQRMEEAMGLIPATRPTSIAEKANLWLDVGEGRFVRDWMVGTDNVLELFENTKGIPREALAQIARTSDPAEVSRILRELIEQGDVLRTSQVSQRARNVGGSTNQLFALRSAMKIQRGPSRLNSMMPGHAIDPTDLDGSMQTIHDFMVNAKVDRATMADHMERFARISDGSRDEVLNATVDMLSDVASKIEDIKVADAESRLARFLPNGAPTARQIRTDVRKLTEAFADDMTLTQMYNVDRLGNPVASPISRIMIDGADEVVADSIHLTSEMLARNIPLPDAREIRRAVSRYQVGRAVFQSRGWDASISTLERVAVKPWKAATLLRLAWPMRVIPEEQIRMGVVGHDSAFSHPFSYVAWVTGRKGSKAVNGSEWDDAQEFVSAMSGRNLGALDSASGRSNVVNMWERVAKDDVHFLPSWRGELALLWSDPVARQAARVGPSNMDELVDWFTEGAGAHHRTRLARGVQGERAQVFVNDELARAKGFADSRAASRAYLQSVIDRIQVKTNGNTDLINAIATGTLDGSDVRKVSPRKLERALEGRIDDAPSVVKGVRSDALMDESGFDHALNSMFDMLMGSKTDKLSRSPAFKQFYFRAIEELLPHMDEATAQAAIANAADVGVSVRGAGSADGLLNSLNDVDEFAKVRALDQTKELLYDLHNNTQFFDAARLVFPFGEAWKEVTGTWLRLIRENPNVVRRSQLMIEGARESGFLYPDENGREMFAYPALGMVADWMFNDQGRVRMEGGVQGLNFVTAGVGPGFGPVIAWPSALALPNSTDYQWLHDILVPFGMPVSDDELSPGGFLDAALPAWARKVVDAVSEGAIDQRVWQSTVADLMRVHVASGDGSIATPEDEAALRRRATRDARFLYFIRGAMQFALPTGPEPSLEVQDKDGRWFNLQVLNSEWRKIRDESPDDFTATQTFVARFGTDPWFIGQAKSQSLRERPVSETGFNWLREHQHLEELLPTTVGLFAPDPEGDFYFGAYFNQLEDGDRVALTAEQQATAARRSAAYMAYNHLMGQAEEAGLKGNDLANYRAQVNAGLMENYGEDWKLAPLGAPTTQGNQQRKMNELRRAVDIPEIAETEAGKALAWWMEQYDHSLEMVRAMTGNPGSTLSGQQATEFRVYLRQAGEALKDVDGFAPLWDRVLSNEVVSEGDDALVAQLEAAA